MDNDQVIWVFSDCAAINKEAPYFIRYTNKSGVRRDKRLNSQKGSSGQFLISEVVSLLGVDRERVKVATFATGMMFDDYKGGRSR